MLFDASHMTSLIPVGKLLVTNRDGFCAQVLVASQERVLGLN